MILQKEQINRYMRHIVMPEISGPGQKKLLESRVCIHAQEVDQIRILVPYLAASGVGQIDLLLDNPDDSEVLTVHVKDLNPDVTLSLVTADFQSDVHIVFAGTSIARVKQIRQGPVIFAAHSPWMGLISRLSQTDTLHEVLQSADTDAVHPDTASEIGMQMAYNLTGCICAIESIKACLGLGFKEGTIIPLTMIIDMLKWDFQYESQAIDNSILNRFLSSTKYPLSSPDHHLQREKLQARKVLIVGTGGLGSPIAYALTQAGVGTLGLMDFDVVDISNLNRQILHSTSRIGMPKVDSAALFLKQLNPDAHLIKYNTAFSRENAEEIISQFDFAAEGLDNLPARYLLNDACHFCGKPFVEAGVLSFHGLAATIKSGEGPCYRCIFPETKDNSNIPSCKETGVLGPVPGVLGIIEAAEILKSILDIGTCLKGRLLMYNSLELDFSVIDIRRNPGCALCGDEPTLTELGTYHFQCDNR